MSEEDRNAIILTWTLQGLWVAFSLPAALAAITYTFRPDLDLFAIIGAFLWLTGFLSEVISDKQKSNFNTKPENIGKVILYGL